MLVMVVFFIAFRWIYLSTLLIRLFLLVLILFLLLILNLLFVFFVSFIWIHLSTALIMLFLLVLILLFMPPLNFLPVWFALSLLRFRLPSRLPMMFILWMVAMMVVIIPSRTV